MTDPICHLEGWAFHILTYEIYQCPVDFLTFTLEKYSLVSAEGKGYVDNVLNGDLTLKSPSGIVVHTHVKGIKQ